TLLALDSFGDPSVALGTTITFGSDLAVPPNQNLNFGSFDQADALSYNTVLKLNCGRFGSSTITWNNGSSSSFQIVTPNVATPAQIGGYGLDFVNLLNNTT